MLRSIGTGIGILAVLASLYAWHAYAAAPEAGSKADRLQAALAKIEAKYEEKVGDVENRTKKENPTKKEKLRSSGLVWGRYMQEVRKAYKDHGYAVPMYVEEE